MTPEEIEALCLQQANGDVREALRLACLEIAAQIESGFNRSKNQTVREIEVKGQKQVR